MTPLARAALLPMAATVLAGCGIAGGIPAGTPNSPSTWSDRPLPPDPALAARVVADGGACRLDDPTDAVVEPVPQILVQDRRTEGSAAFLFRTATHFGGCQISVAGGSGGGIGPPLEPMEAMLTIDENSGVSLGDAEARTLGGRFSVPAASIVVVLKDGRNLVASVANGYWLAWWPWTNGVNAEQVIAFDAHGNVLAKAEVVTP